MEKIVSLRRNQEFRRVYTKGKYFSSSSLVTYALRNRLGFLRLGITTSKKIGNAVKRNRARRVIRVAYRMLKQKLSGNFDVVVVARSKATEIKSKDIFKELSYSMKKLGLIK